MAKKVQPLEEFNFSVVQQPLFGLLRNVDSDLRRLVTNLAETNDFEELRRVTLLSIMLRFAINSYQAVSFLLSDTDDHPRRLPQFVLVVPPINRQLIDLWFSLVYIMDDFAPRALAYDQCGYRETGEEVEKMKARYGSDPKYRSVLLRKPIRLKFRTGSLPSNFRNSPVKARVSYNSWNSCSTTTLLLKRI
jgi:hypothetical protein